MESHGGLSEKLWHGFDMKWKPITNREKKTTSFQRFMYRVKMIIFFLRNKNASVFTIPSTKEDIRWMYLSTAEQAKKEIAIQAMMRHVLDTAKAQYLFNVDDLKN
jgi:hypothetical protein